MSRVTLASLPKNAGFYERLKRQFKISILISENNPQSLQFFENLTTIRRLRRRQVESRSNIIHCFSMFRLYYEMWMGCIFTACMIQAPAETAFAYFGKGHLANIGLGLDVCCFIDIILRFRTGYVDHQERKVIMEQSKIAIHYITSCVFYCDVLSTIPSPNYIIPQEYLGTHALMLLGLLRLARLVTAYRYIVRSAQYFHLENKAFRIGIMAFFFFLICHWTCCAVYLMPQFRYELYGEYYPNSWLTVSNLTNKTVMEKYVATFHKSCAYILAVKQGNLKSLAWEEKVLACFCIVGGKVLVFFITVHLVGNLLSFWSLESKYWGIVQELEGYISRKHLKPAVRNRLLHYYNYKFRRTYFQENTIKNILSERLRREINAQVLQKFTKNVKLFNSLQQDTINKIIANLQLELFLPHDIIIKAGYTGDCMYFVSSGTVAVYTPSGKEVCHLQDGDYFGEISLILKDQRRTAHVIAVETCEVYKLTKRSFNSCMKSEKAVLRKMALEAQQRIEITQIFEDINLRSHRYSRAD